MVQMYPIEAIAHRSNNTGSCFPCAALHPRHSSQPPTDIAPRVRRKIPRIEKVTVRTSVGGFIRLVSDVSSWKTSENTLQGVL